MISLGYSNSVYSVHIRIKNSDLDDLDSVIVKCERTQVGR